MVSKSETLDAWQKSSEFIERYGVGQTSMQAANDGDAHVYQRVKGGKAKS